MATAPRLDPTERITVVGDSVEADSIPTVPDLYAITLARSDTALVLSFWMADPPGALGTAWLAGLDLDTDRDATTPPGALWEFEDGTRVGPDFRALPAGPGAAPGVQGTWSLEHTYAGDWTTVPSRVAPGRRHLLTIPRQAVLDTGSDWPFVLALYQGPGPGWTLAQAWVGAPDGAPARRVYPYYGPGGFALRARSPLVRRPLLPGERPILTSL